MEPEFRKTIKKGVIAIVIFDVIIVGFLLLASKIGFDDSYVLQMNQLKKMYPGGYEQVCTAESVERFSAIAEKVANYQNPYLFGNAIQKSYVMQYREAIDGLTYIPGTISRIFIYSEDGKKPGRKSVKNADLVYVSPDGVQVSCKGSVFASDGIVKTSYYVIPSENYNLENGDNPIYEKLTAQCYDPTLLRSFLGMETAEKLGLITPRYEYAEVWLNGVCRGTYIMRDNKSVAEEGVDFVVRMDSRTDREGEPEFTTSNGFRFVILAPDSPSEEKINEIAHAFEKVEAEIYARHYGEASKLLDMDSMAKQYLLAEYFKLYSSKQASALFYSVDGKIYAGAMCDFELSSGNVSTEKASYYKYGESYEGLHVKAGFWYKPLMKCKEFKELTAQEFIKSKEIFEDIYKSGGSLDGLLSETNITAFKRNFEEAGWNVGEQYNGSELVPFGSYDENVAFLRTWFKKRYHWMETEF